MKSLHNKMPRIQKRNHSPEDFNTTEIILALHATGLNDDDFQRVAKNVSQYIPKQHDTIVTSTRIGDLVQAQLNAINSNDTNLFRWYEKTKETT